jgi:hypothetical protein
MAYTDIDLDGMAADLAEFNQRNTLPDILAQYKTLLEDYRRLKSDFEEERDVREKYKRAVRDHERNPFVLVLVDGDGYVFSEGFVGKKGDGKKGDGGAEAARKLNEVVGESLRKKGLEHCRVMVRAYADVAGLSRALAAAGMVGHESRALVSVVLSSPWEAERVVEMEAT